MTRLKRNDPYWVYLKISEDPGWIFKPWLHRDTKKKMRPKKKKIVELKYTKDGVEYNKDHRISANGYPILEVDLKKRKKKKNVSKKQRQKQKEKLVKKR